MLLRGAQAKGQIKHAADVVCTSMCVCSYLYQVEKEWVRWEHAEACRREPGHIAMVTHMD